MKNRRAWIPLAVGLSIVVVAGSFLVSLPNDEGDTEAVGVSAVGPQIHTVRDGGAARAREPATRVIVTRDSTSLPDGCQPGQIARLVIGFFTAANRGQERAASFVDFESGLPAASPSYSVSENLARGQRRHFVAYDEVRLRRYLDRRHGQREHLALRELQVIDHSAGLGHIAYRLRRRADDRRRYGRRLQGKGAVDCAGRKIILWAAGNAEEGLPSSERPPLCPQPRRKTELPVACSRRSG